MQLQLRRALCVFLFINWISSIYAQCQKSNGFFPDPDQCDKYYECVGGVPTQRLCQDGLMFNDLSYRTARCDLPSVVDCSTRPNLQPAQPTPHCPRKWGFFASDEPSAKACGQFYRCVDGVANPTDCPAGLVFSDESGNCEWPEVATNCKPPKAEDVDFVCPPPAPSREFQGVPNFHDPRYPHETDCKQFYVCIGGKTPRLLGCEGDLVFNAQTSTCDEPINVPGCETSETVE